MKNLLKLIFFKINVPIIKGRGSEIIISPKQKLIIFMVWKLGKRHARSIDGKSK